ncbi:MAG: LptA/OstA family protein [Candidatus Caenarcaniphilales bacterium]|nr:LptA/OstA family protein [Candidatus Caenarcaniphilales bacterium]
MLKNIKPLIYFAAVAVMVLYLTSSVINSARLVSDFEKNVVGKTFQPEGTALEVSEYDGLARQSWIIKAERSIGSSDLNTIKAFEVEGIVLDESDKPKIKVDSSQALLNRESWKTILQGDTLVEIVQANLKMQADRFLIEKDKPFEALGKVKLLLSEDGKKHINAERALIGQKLDDLVMYGVEESPISEGMTVKGKVMNFDFADNKPRRIVVTNDVVVRSKSTTCSAGQMEITLNAAGKPTIAIFTGNPVAYQNGNRISADRIEYIVSTGAVKAVGNVRTS